MKKLGKIGKIIVIDGVDGVGKRTQSELLVSRLKKLKIKSIRIDFPQYENNFFGKNLKEFLHDPAFNFMNVHPKIASMVYAADRWESKNKIEKYLNQGYIVVLDRYVSSNQIHQRAKFFGTKESESKRLDFMKWLDNLEHKVFKIPRPNIILYLNLKLETSQKLMENKGKDVAEKDIIHQRNSQKSALKLAGELKKFVIINCDTSDGLWIKERGEISEDIFQQIKKYI